MKNKARIFGIGLVLMLVVSMIVAAVPAAAAPPGDTVWVEQSKPGISAYPIYSGSDGTNFAQSPSTGRVYIVDEVKMVIKTGASGTVWSSIDNYATGASTINATWQAQYGAARYCTPQVIAVAPDNDQAIAVSDNFGFVRISNDGGVNWSTLPAITNASSATINGTVGRGYILDVAISPARSGTLLGREYAVAIADDTANSVTDGDVMMIGATATWESVATNTGTADFYRVMYSPGYLGDRVLLATSVTAGGVVQLHYLNTSTNLDVAGPATVGTGAGATDYAGTIAAALANKVNSIDLAVPSDFDPTTTSGRIVYVGIGTNTAAGAADDVYRMNSTTARPLNAVTATGTNAIDSVGYAGTVSEGTLFCGYIDATTAVAAVKRTAEPTATAPTWTSCYNNPTGSTFCRVKPAYDFTTSNKLFAFTQGAESAWSVSDDGGVSFYQRSWIDNGVASDWVLVENMAIAADGSAMYIVTDDGADLHLWYTPLPPSSMSAQRMYTNMANGDGVATKAGVYLNPDWATSPTIYIVDNSVAGASAIYVSNNGGATWATRTGPGAADMDLFTVVDKTTVYAVISSNFYKSINQCWTWEPAVAWNTSWVAGKGSMWMGADGSIFIADDGVRKSSTGASGTWSTVGSYGASGNALYAVTAPDYEENGLVYTCDNVTGRVLRLDVATSTYRDTGYVPTTANGCIKMQFENGMLYVITPYDTWRNSTPTADLSTMQAMWQSVNISAASPAAVAGGSGFSGQANAAVMYDNSIYVNGGYNTTTGGMLPAANLEDIWGVIDSTVSGKPIISAPVAGQEVSIDPTNGRGVPIQLVWSAVGDGQGAINRWDIQVWNKDAGSLTATWVSNFTTTSASSPAILSSALGTWPAMLPNTTYVMKVRGDQTVGGANLNTQWSDTVEFTVQSGTQVTQTYAGPQIIGPAGGTTTSLNPGFAWAPVAGAVEYQFVLATDATLTKAIGGTPVTVTQPSFQATGLDYGTTYFWGVKVTKPSPGPQTIGTFSTMEKPVVVAPPTAPSQPDIIVPTQTPPDITVNVPEPTSAIPAAGIWAVIGIGAVLVVAVLVLIVRTRRPV